MPEIHQHETHLSTKIDNPAAHTKVALENLRKEHHFSPLLSVVNQLFEGINQDKYLQTLSPGEILFDRGEDKHIYILTSGELAIQVQSRSGYKNVAKVRATNTLGEGTIFGRSFKPARAVALSQMQAIKLSDADLQAFEQNHPELMHRFYRLTMEKMNHHLREANHQLSEYESLIDHLSQYLQDESSGLIEMLIYLRETFLLSRIMLVEYHPVVQNLQVLRYDSDIKTDSLIYESYTEKHKKSIGSHSMNYVLQIGEQILGTLFIETNSDDPLSPKDEQVIARSIPTMSAVLKAHQSSEEQSQKTRLSNDKDLRDTIF